MLEMVKSYCAGSRPAFPPSEWVGLPYHYIILTISKKLLILSS
ncbi:unnamed protein product, partial [Vitis vinifera]|uniref:Uncharacterized protein n=1 Tax=Vitis vinifera TaxID=29760 RepID=D7UBI2_VITVI